MSDFTTVKAAARGGWPAIWSALGIGDLPRMGRHGPCPGCGGRDRFRLVPDRIDDGGWICGRGGDPTGGDGFALLVHTGIARTAGEALHLVAAHLGMDAKADPATRQRAREAAQRRDRERLEVALAHELRVLLLVLDNRIAGREIERDQRFRAARPEWQPLPAEHWEREHLAARRVVALLGKLYPPNRRNAA